MGGCSRTGCPGAALASWWMLCAGCTVGLIEPAGPRPDAVVEQHQAAGWEAMEWAERIAPGRWGNASDDGWMMAQRCLAFAAVVTGRSNGCVHTTTPVATPVVAVARAVGVLHCPSCAETVVATTSTAGHACDRCRRVTVSAGQRVALVAGASLIVVAQLCDGCLPTVMAVVP